MEVPQEDLTGWVFRQIVRKAGIDPDANRIFSISVGNGWSEVSYWPKDEPLEFTDSDSVATRTATGPGIGFNWFQES